MSELFTEATNLSRKVAGLDPEPNDLFDKAASLVSKLTKEMEESDCPELLYDRMVVDAYAALAYAHLDGKMAGIAALGKELRGEK